MPRKRRVKKLSDHLRDALRDAGVSRYQVSKETGISQGQLSRFVHGESWLSEANLDRLVEFLDLEIRKRGE